MNDRIRALRREHGWTQMQLAERCGCRQSTIGAIEAGIRKPSIKLLPILAKTLGTTADYLLTGEIVGA